MEPRRPTAPSADPAAVEVAFAAAMDRLGPFEPAPALAVACSGGRDSMALALLADRWARARRGRAVALVVDHGLRTEARAEARLARRRLTAAGVESRLLVWRGAKPGTGIQAAARTARYRLLEGWCARNGVLHLLAAHQRDDQAETVLFRLARGSGPDGLAGIPALAERAAVRLLRPLLGVSRAALGDWLAARGAEWIDDPSNRDPAFARVRIRGLLPALEKEGLGADALCASAARMAASRATLEAAVARLLAQAAVCPQGYARIPRAALADAPPAIARRALAALLGCIGGGAYPPRGARLDALYAAIAAPPFRGRTLAGCRVLAEPGGDGDGLLVVREPRAAAEKLTLAPGEEVLWDGRFRIRLAGGRATVAALGADGWAELVRRAPHLRGCKVPPPARPALPALRDRFGLVAVPHLGYGRVSRKAVSLKGIQVLFRPARALCPAEFPVA